MNAAKPLNLRYTLYMERVKALDGLRGIALIAVVAYHAVPDILGGGFLGVEMFFVLSGFLLITLLLDEVDRRGLMDPWAYARRRLRRIAPAMVVFLLVLAAIVPLVASDDAHRLPKDIVSSLLGLTNWHLIADGASYFAQTGRPSLVRHLWSIAVELQVYVLIPFIAAFIARNSRKRSAALLVVGIATSATLMAVLYASPDPSRAYYGTDTRVGALLTGALVALVARELGSKRRAKLTTRATMLLFVGGGVAMWTLFIAADERARALYPAGFLVTQLATAGLIIAATQPGLPSRILSDQRLRWVGVRSYGIYLWHWPAVALLRPGVDVDWPRPVTATLGIAIAVVLGALSYRYIERPFLRSSSWARSPLPRMTRAGAAAWVAATLIIVALVARTSTTDPITESLLAGEAALAEQGTTPAKTGKDDPKVATGDDGPLAVARPVAAPGKLPSAKGPKPGTVKISAVGDSVMLGAASALKQRFGSKSFINAEKNRRWRQGATVVKDWRKSGHLGRVLIAHLGNNGTAKPEEIEAVLKEAKPTEHILLVTVRVTKPWEGAVNDVLRKSAKKHAKVWLVDWHAVSSGHRDWFYSDGTHMTRKGAEAYTKLIAAKIPADKPKPTPTKAPPSKKPKATPTPGLVEDVLKPD